MRNILIVEDNIDIHNLMLNTNNIVSYLVDVNVEIERSWESYLIGNEKLSKLIKVAMNEYDGEEYGKMIIKDFDYIDKLVEKFNNLDNCLINGTTGK